MTGSAPRFVARWDLDKTYLRTEFDSIRALVRTAVERPDHKRAVPGAPALMRALREAGAWVHILSGSPEQLRRRIRQKLRLDGVRYESLTLKPNLQNILRLRLRAIRGQLGYKLPALLRARCELPTQRASDGTLLPEILLGDDAEADALVYCLYADVCEGLVEPDMLAAILRAAGAYDDSISDALRLASYLDAGPVVRRVLIHLDRQSAPSTFRRFGSRVVPFYNYAQAAFVLLDDGLLEPAGLWAVVADLVLHHHFDTETVARSYAELVARGALSGRGVERLAQTPVDGLQRAATDLGALHAALSRWRQVEHYPGPTTAPRVDYLELARRVRHRPRR